MFFTERSHRGDEAEHRTRHFGQTNPPRRVRPASAPAPTAFWPNKRLKPSIAKGLMVPPSGTQTGRPSAAPPEDRSMLRLRVFVSSPGDVGAERAVALAVAERLQFEFRGRIQLETYLWERSLLRATETFQAQILDIQEADLALFILWARMGTPLPLDEFSRHDGSQ